MARHRPVEAPKPPTGLAPFPAHLRTRGAYAEHTGIDDRLVSRRREWHDAQRAWLAEHGYADKLGAVDWHRFRREHPEYTNPTAPANDHRKRDHDMSEPNDSGRPADESAVPERESSQIALEVSL